MYRVTSFSRVLMSLSILENNSCKPFTTLNEGNIANVCRYYDSDTVPLAWVDKSGDKVRMGCRTDGTDAPGMKSASEHKKNSALLPEKSLNDPILGTEITILNPGCETYGRLRCDLRISEIPSIKTGVDQPQSDVIPARHNLNIWRS